MNEIIRTLFTPPFRATGNGGWIVDRDGRKMASRMWTYSGSKYHPSGWECVRHLPAALDIMAAWESVFAATVGTDETDCQAVLDALHAAWDVKE